MSGIMRFLIASVILFGSLTLIPAVVHAATVTCPSSSYADCTSTEDPNGRVLETATLPAGGTITVGGKTVTLPKGSTITRDYTKRYGQGTITYKGPDNKEIHTDTQAIGLKPWGTPAPTPAATAPTPGTTPSGSSASAATAPAGGCAYYDLACKAGEAWNKVWDFTGWLTLEVVWYLMSVVAYMFFMAAEFLMWMGTTLFDNVLYFLVVNMSVFIQHENAQGMRDAWIAIRDLMNIGIIAGFIIVGISTILQAQQYNANRFLARLIIAALLVNFSYFFAGAVIDASNFIATAAYKSKLMPRECVNLEDAKTLSFSMQPVLLFVDRKDLCSVAATFTKTMALGTWDEIREFGRENTKVGDSNKTIFFVGMIGGFFFVITGFVFFSAAILLIGRFIVLILLLVTSPVGVAGINIPYLDEYAKKWWGMLFSHAFLAPVFIILVAIGLKISMGVKDILLRENSLDQANYAAIAKGSFQEASNTIPMFISFFIGVGLMYAALQIARGMSESGKEFVGAIYEGLQKRVGSIYGDFYQATAGSALKLPSMMYDASIAQLGRIPVLGPMLFSRFTTPIGKMLRQDPGGKPFGASKGNAEAAKETQEYMKSLETFGKPIGWLMTPKKSLEKLALAVFSPLENLYEKVTMGSINDLLAKAERGEKLSPAQRRKLERYVAAMKDEDFDNLTLEELKRLAPFMTAKQYSKAMGRTDLNEHQRKEVQNSRWKELETARKNEDHDEVARLLKNMDKNERKLLLVERDEYRTDKQMLAALDAKTYQEIVDDTDIFGGDDDFVVDGEDLRDYRAKQVANTPGKISDTDAKRIKDGDIDQSTIDNMTPAQARRLYKNTKDPVLQAKLAKRFPELEGPGPSLADEDEDEENAKKKKGEEQNSSDNPRFNTPYK